MISDIHVLIDDGGITISLALGCRVVARSVCKIKCIRLSSRNVCLEHPEATHHVIELFTNSLDIFLRSLLFCLWIFLGMNCCHHSSLRLSTPFSGFGIKWCWKTMTMMRGNFYTLSHYCCMFTSELSYGYPKTSQYESVQLPIYMYAMELSKTKLHRLACFKHSFPFCTPASLYTKINHQQH